jgi:two-component system, chemotaxis family, protein-glutamate methylesterase/glutaminase
MTAAARDIVCIGASAGGLQPLREVLRGLPPTLPAAVCVVVHSGADNPSILAPLLRRATPMTVTVPRDHQTIERGVVYVAPQDRHLLVKPDELRVVRGPRENRFRPAVDPLFRTAAAAYGPRVIGVVLSGGMNDGTSGLLAIKSSGGVAIVQDPNDAQVPQMPLSAIAEVAVDHVLEARKIGLEIARLSRDPQRESTAAAVDPADLAADPAEMIPDALQTGRYDAPPSGYSCPDCGGALWDVGAGDRVEFRCHVGHKFSSDGLLAAKDIEVEGAVWSALRALEEEVSLRRKMALRLGERFPALAEPHARHAEVSERQARLLRKVLLESHDGEQLDIPMTPQPATRAPARRRMAPSPSVRKAKR